MLGGEQEFKHLATPEGNRYVGAYHGILKREPFNRFEYYSFAEVHDLNNQFVDDNNNKHRHGSIKRKTLIQK